MNSKYIRAKIDSMAKTRGVAGCAAVEISAGMVWHAAGEMENFISMAEAASDYWRLYLRLRNHYSEFGELTYCMLVHERYQLILTSCGDDMVFITACEKGHELNLSDWNIRINQLRLILEAE